MATPNQPSALALAAAESIIAGIERGVLTLWREKDKAAFAVLIDAEFAKAQPADGGAVAASKRICAVFQAKVSEAFGGVQLSPAGDVLESAIAREIAAHCPDAAALQAEIDGLRQAHWDARAKWGFDNDGQPTPQAVAGDFAAFMTDDWQTVGEYAEATGIELDEARKETDDLRLHAEALAVNLEKTAMLLSQIWSDPAVDFAAAMAAKSALSAFRAAYPALAVTPGGDAS